MTPKANGAREPRTCIVWTFLLPVLNFVIERVGNQPVHSVVQFHSNTKFAQLFPSAQFGGYEISRVSAG